MVLATRACVLSRVSFKREITLQWLNTVAPLLVDTLQKAPALYALMCPKIPDSTTNECILICLLPKVSCLMWPQFLGQYRSLSRQAPLSWRSGKRWWLFTWLLHYLACELSGQFPPNRSGQFCCKPGARSTWKLLGNKEWEWNNQSKYWNYQWNLLKHRMYLNLSWTFVKCNITRSGP